MGWEIEKDVLHPGRVVVPDPTRPGRHLAYTFTRGDAERMAATGNAQLRDGWHTPVAWEHQDVQPVRLSQAETDREFARACFGHAAGYRVDPADGRVRVVLRGDDPADLEQFKKLRFVSPEIQWDWTDSDGRTWHGPTITHIAATARPVQRHQHPVGARLSLRTHEIPSFEKFVTALRVAPTIGASTGPGGRLRLSLTDYEAPMADTLDFGGGAGAGDDKGGKGSPWEKIAASLMEHCGIDLGDVSKINDPDMFATLVDVATRNYKAGEQPDVEDDDLADLDEEPNPDEAGGDLDQPPPGATAAQPPPLQMSLKKQQEAAEGFARKNLGSRIDGLEATRRVTPAIAADLRKQLPAVRLSFAANADLRPNPLTHTLDAYEALPEGAAWNPTGARGGKKGVRLSQRGTPAARPPYDDGARPNDPEHTNATLKAWRETK